MSDLFQFIADLALDPRRQELFEANPQAMIETVGLVDSDRIQLDCGDRNEVTAVFSDELSTDEFAAVTGSCCFFDPGPDPSPDPDPLVDSEEDDEQDTDPANQEDEPEPPAKKDSA